LKLLKRIKRREQRRVHRIRNAQLSRGIKPRISVFRSSKHIYAQIIDDSKQVTLASISTLSLANKSGDKKTCARVAGLELGKLALTMSVKDVFFDRGGYLYHGRIKALADGLREAGLNF
jgi:large subunit ribosomal protein L18